MTAAPARAGNIAGMSIQSAAIGSPLLRMTDASGNQIKVDAGDMIISIGGRATNSGQALVNSYQNAGQQFQVTLYDSRTNRVARFFASKGGAQQNNNDPKAGRIFVLLAGMTDQNIGRSVRASFNGMKSVVELSLIHI